jgi:hypothetical protein
VLSEDHEKPEKRKKEFPEWWVPHSLVVELISTSAFSYIRSAADDAALVRSEIAVEQTRMIRNILHRVRVF